MSDPKEDLIREMDTREMRQDVRPEVEEYLRRERRCECEHDSHDGEDTTSTAHRYGEVPATGVLGTPLGDFRVCRACYEAGHMQAEGGDGEQGYYRPF